MVPTRRTIPFHDHVHSGLRAHTIEPVPGVHLHRVSATICQLDVLAAASIVGKVGLSVDRRGQQTARL